MRILGVDHGSKRVGLALSDEGAMLASPLETVPRDKIMERISVLVKERGIGRIVVGIPRNMDGSYGFKAEEVRQFMKKLAERVSVPLSEWDERLTTQAVEKQMIQADVSRQRRKEVVDQLAAQQILQGYLDAQELRRQGNVEEP